MFLPHHQTAGQNHNIQKANKYFYCVARVHIFDNGSNKLKLHSRWNWLNLWNACYHTVNNLLSPQILSKNVKIIPVLLYGCKNWILTLREQQRSRVFKNKVLRGIFRRKRGDVRGGCYIMRNFTICFCCVLGWWNVMSCGACSVHGRAFVRPRH